VDSRPSRAATGVALAMSGGLVAAAVVALGAPDLGQAGELLGGAYPTVRSAIALLSVICYAAVLGVAIAVAVSATRRGSGRVRASTARAGLFALAGVILLVMSIASRIGEGERLCCGTGAHQVQEVISLAR
jgi:hypothetical protein